MRSCSTYLFEVSAQSAKKIDESAPEISSRQFVDTRMIVPFLSTVGGGFACGRRAVVMDHVHDVIGKLLSKGLMKFQFAHDLLWEYFQEATPARIQVLLELLRVAFSRPRLV